jgi:hypothetical protein
MQHERATLIQTDSNIQTHACISLPHTTHTHTYSIDLRIIQNDYGMWNKSLNTYDKYNAYIS